MWQSLLNIQPITQGILNQRWGYAQFAGLANSPNRLSNYQSDALGTRAILAAGLNGVSAFNEDGTTYNSNIFTPVATNGIIRSITSRNYQYFCDGYNALDPVSHRTGDSLKWSGAATGGITNNGIVNTDVMANNVGGGTGSNTLGPNTGSTSADIGGGQVSWNNTPGIFTNNIATAANVVLYETVTGTQKPNGGFSYAFSNIHTQADVIRATGFNFSSVASPTVAGIQVSFTYKAVFSDTVDYNPTAILQTQLVKNNALVGSFRTANLNIDGNVHTVTIGSATDTWGTTFAPADIANAQFGVGPFASVNFRPNQNLGAGVFTPTATISVSYVTITVYLSGASGTSSGSGNGVGIVSGVGGGSINLTLGRTYYLVPNSSLTGHFGDLSSASGNSGAALNAEYNLILATYNDPQVDFKYILATADGNDPSTLYEVQVLAPGLTISSWSITTNVVAFVGTMTGPVFTAGQTVTIGGLNHGSYLNGQTLTVLASPPPSSTGFSANFTHANDSFTEIGIAGSSTFAIPNGITAVVDNTPDPTLVLNQPLVFTDAFGNEFGLTLNDPPPAGNLLIKHQGRLWMAGVPGATHSVFFSKAVNELTLPNGFIAGKYEESWPGSNYFDVSDGAESVSGLLSDGTTLYIGTQNHIRRLLGNSPLNFQQPQIVHPHVGLLNQEVWQLVFMQGAPSGSIWMTPDFRVMQSDFNTYVDIGTPIQDILNNLKLTAQSLAHAAFVADGEFELYILAVPYKQSTFCDTHLVFDLRARHWFVWQPATGSLSTLFNLSQNGTPQWLFINGTANQLNIYSPTATTDAGVTIPVSATTTWMHLGEPTRRKLLNEVQVYGNTGMTMSVFGANNLQDFSSPVRTIAYNRTLKQSPFGHWSLYLTGTATHNKYFQFTFSSSNGQIPFLGSYAISLAALDDI